MQSKFDYFLSFSQQDGRNYAYQIADILFPGHGQIPPRIFIDNAWKHTTIMVGDLLSKAICKSIDTSNIFMPIITPSFNERENATPMRELVYAIQQGRQIRSIWIDLHPQLDAASLNPKLRSIVHKTNWICCFGRLDEELIKRHLIGTDRDVLGARVVKHNEHPRDDYLGNGNMSFNTPVHPSNSRKVCVLWQPGAVDQATDLLDQLHRYRVQYPLLGPYGIYSLTTQLAESQACIILIRSLDLEVDNALKRILDYNNDVHNNEIRIIAILLHDLAPENYDAKLFPGFDQLLQLRVLVQKDTPWNEIIWIVARTMATCANHQNIYYGKFFPRNSA